MKIINRCPHITKHGIYGDEIRLSGGYRLLCADCGTLLDGPVSLSKEAIWRKLDEFRKSMND